MEQTLIEYGLDVIVGERVVNHAPVPAVLDELGLLQYTKLMRNGRFRHTEKDGDIAHTHLRPKQRAKDFNPRGVAEHLKNIRQINQDVLVGHMFPNVVYDFLVDGIAIAPVNLRCVRGHQTDLQSIEQLNICSTYFLYYMRPFHKSQYKFYSSGGFHKRLRQVQNLRFVSSFSFRCENDGEFRFKLFFHRKTGAGKQSGGFLWRIGINFYPTAPHVKLGCLVFIC